MMIFEEWSKPDAVFSSDACPTGCGDILESNSFNSEFPEFVINMDLHINILEMMSVIVCV